jgi:hypothetical protein
MAWSSVSPDETLSVSANSTPMKANTTYIETTMNNDHYWNIGADEDGHHKQVQSPKLAADLTLSAGMDGGMYLKETTGGRTAGFYKTKISPGVFTVYQFIPSFLSGTFTPTELHSNIVAVPNSTYGNIYMYKNDGSNTGVNGFFKAAGGVCQSYSMQLTIGGSSSVVLEFKNNNSDLNIKAKLAASGVAGEYQYRIVYWAM